MWQHISRDDNWTRTSRCLTIRLFSAVVCAVDHREPSEASHLDRSPAVTTNSRNSGILARVGGLKTNSPTDQEKEIVCNILVAAQPVNDLTHALNKRLDRVISIAAEDLALGYGAGFWGRSRSYSFLTTA
jgi:hypothetical protein